MIASKITKQKYIMLLMLLAVIFAGQVLGYSGQNAGALDVYNREVDYVAATHADGINAHGDWSYHMMTKADVDANGRGDSAYWTDCGYVTSVSGYRFYNASPKFANLIAGPNTISVEWNKATNDDKDYMESEIAVTFTVTEDGIYNIVGDLLWSNELLTDPRSYVHIGTVKAAETVYNNLWSSARLRGAGATEASPEGDSTVKIDPASPEAVVGYTDNPALLGITLEAGDKILMVFQTGLLNYRRSNFHDRDVCIERVPFEPVVHNRYDAWDVDTHDAVGHGQWSYYSMTKADADASGLADASKWVAGAYESHYGWYSHWLEEPQPDWWRGYGRQDALYCMWNKAADTVYTWRDGYFMTVFTASEAGSYSVAGDLLWSNSGATDTRGYVKIGYVKDGAFSSLFTSVQLRDDDNASPYSMIPEEAPVAVPGFKDDPILTAGVNLEAGDQIIIAMQIGALNYRGFMLHDSAVDIMQDEVGPDATYNRMVNWGNDTHTQDAGVHGQWSYHMVKGTDVTAYGRGDSAYWEDLAYLSNVDRYQLTYPLPAFWMSQTFNDRVYAQWNKSDNDHLDYQASELAMVFTATEPGDYDVVGDLLWSTKGATDARAYVHVGTIKAGESTYNNIWSSIQLRDADNLSPYTAIPQDAPVSVPDFADNAMLQAISLSAGDKLVISLQTGLNYRGVYLHDSGVSIQKWAQSVPTADYNRSADMLASIPAGNSHGTKLDPTGNAWEYWIKPFAHDRLDYLPGELEALNWDAGHARYEKIDNEGVYWDFHAFAGADGFEAEWNNNGIDTGRQSWVVATFKNPYPATVNFDIHGATTYEMERTGSLGGERCEISVVSSDFSTKSVAWTHDPVDGSVGVHDVPDPALYAIPVGPGEYIALAFRGNRLNYRNVIWHNAALTITADPSSFANVEMSASPAAVMSGVTPSIGLSQAVIGNEIALSAVDFAGACPTAYVFDSWEVDGAFYSDLAEATLTVDADVQVVAVFVESNECGDVCRPYPQADISEDCTVNIADFAMLASDWMVCTDPSCD